MSRGFYTLTSSMLTQQRKLEITSNNIANINTAGYKKEQAVTSTFGELYLNRLRQDGIYQSATPLNETSLIRIVEDNNTIHSQGELDFTEGTFDFAIIGEGFFQVQNNGETFYTRDGSFNLDEEGFLVSGNKGRVQGGFGDVYIGTDKFEFNNNGDIYVDGELIDTLAVYTFEDYNVLDKIAEGMFSAEGEPTLIDFPDIEKGVLERSNVNMTQEMSDIIDTQRTLQTSAQALKMYDTIMDNAVNQIGRVG